MGSQKTKMAGSYENVDLPSMYYTPISKATLYARLNWTKPSTSWGYTGMYTVHVDLVK